MSTIQWALLFHVLGAFLLVAGTAVAGAAFESARRRERTEEVALLLGLARSGAVLVALGTVLVLGCGLWLVHLEQLGLGTRWIAAALVLFVVMVVTGALGGQAPKRARKLATSLGAGAVTPELRGLLDDGAARALNYASAAAALAIIVDMVWKPS